MKKRERGEEDYQSDADDGKMQFFPVVYLLRYICEGLNVCVCGGGLSLHISEIILTNVKRNYILERRKKLKTNPHIFMKIKLCQWEALTHIHVYVLLSL